MCVCAHCVFFLHEFFCFSVKNMWIYVQKSNSRFWSSHIAAIYIAWDFWKKKFRSGVFHVPVCYFLIKITLLYINWEKLLGKSIYLSVYMYIHLLFSLPSSSHPGESIYTILYNFIRDLHSSLAFLGQLFFFVPNPGCGRTRMPINFFF